jgi:hypothetical protein
MKERIMGQTVNHKLIVRLAALAAVTLCLILVVRQDDQVGLGMAQSMAAFQPQAPIIVARNEPGSPLVISAERQLAKTEQAPEVAFNVTNVMKKTISAFAIKVEVMSDSKVVNTVALYNLELSANDLPPNRSLSRFDTYENLSDAQHRVTLSVDYVEFSDGKIWGQDSAKSAERVGGSRAAIETFTTRLTGIIRGTNPNDIANVLESLANLAPPPQHSDEWNDGFQGAARSLTNRLKRANQSGGLGQVNSELSRYVMRLSGNH